VFTNLIFLTYVKRCSKMLSLKTMLTITVSRYWIFQANLSQN